MKDKVFIAWSGTHQIASMVKRILEKEHSYICEVGGNEDNSSRYFTIGDTVMQQMNNCNQAIIILQKKQAERIVSSNLFFELGYVFAKYGIQKVHVVQKKSEILELPTDFSNAFVKSVDDTDDETFAQGIAEYFIERQKMSIDENKMKLIDNRYLIHDLIQCHYSDSGSKCSDYELAQYIIFYMQAAHMFDDQQRVAREILKFKEAHYQEFSVDLRLAVDIALAYFEVIISRRFLPGNIICIDKNDYRNYISTTRSVIQVLDREVSGAFYDWAKIFVIEQRTYVHMLYAENPEVSEERKKTLYRNVIDDAKTSLELIADMEAKPVSKKNNDGIGILSVLKAYLYRNLFAGYKVMGDAEEALHWLEESKSERSSLKRNFAQGIVDSMIYENFLMEYYLILAEYICFSRDYNLDIDTFEAEMDLEEIGDFLDKVNAEEQQNIYIKRITEYYTELNG